MLSQKMYRRSPRALASQSRPSTFPPQISSGFRSLFPLNESQGEVENTPVHSGPATESPVLLRVYDLSNGRIARMSPLLMRRPIRGIWHTGLQVFGMEYYYGDAINKLPPAMVESAMNLRPARIEHLGNTTVTQREFECFLNAIKDRFTPEEYKLMEWNCNHFTNICSRFLLGGKEIPQEIQMLPQQIEESLVGQVALYWMKAHEPPVAEVQKSLHYRSHSTVKSGLNLGHSSRRRGLSAAPRRQIAAATDDDDASLIVHSPSVKREMTRQRHRRHESHFPHGRRQARGEASARQEASPRNENSPRELISTRASSSRATLTTQRSQSPISNGTLTARESTLAVSHLVSIRREHPPQEETVSLVGLDSQVGTPDHANDSRLCDINATFLARTRRQMMPRATSQLTLTETPLRRSPPPTRIFSADDSNVHGGAVSLASASTVDSPQATHEPKWGTPDSLVEMLRPSPLAAKTRTGGLSPQGIFFSSNRYL
eukprot:Gregarina_sp_Poly_1__3773@NODE_2119_length_2648_cov_136_409919_g188_i2_p1_GENE_NODE_2119_length_2648_cov_136_409919_g188_i2NODE_2119_length_2648_cov_136_409919_g188_i2_p1_ORF_typecomplete_len488_score46_01Peptidase_C97/PF05903_14/2_9e28LRAT/PF04970_13/0_1_NODE_2119_length_2648_cov_136_409919_g188_i211292592